MRPEDVRFPVAYYDGTAYFLAPADRYTGSYFGGPSMAKVTGLRHGPEPLHHILTVDGRIVPALYELYLSDLPLFYGMCYESCDLTYLVSSDACRITKLKPRKSGVAWPYRDYPRYLPYMPMRLARKTRCPAKQFERFTWQGLKIGADTLAVIVPPLFVGGTSIWGPWGDVEHVQIIFECDLKKKTIRATNQCS